MARTLNGDPLPDDCPCPIAVITTHARVGGRQTVSRNEQIRPLTGCPHHGDDPAATAEPVAPVGA